MGFEKRNLSHKKKLGGGGVVEGMEHDSAMKNPGEPDVHAHAVFFSGLVFRAPFFSLRFSGHWWRPRWPLNRLEAWRYLKSHLFAILNS
jgi:hypothetical protein